jgi:hypothetical protein
MTFYYLDNSEGSGVNAEALNSNLVEQLKEKLEGLKRRTDNYFVLLAANGEQPKQKTEINSTAGSEFLLKYLSRPSKESDPYTERQMMRDLFRDYPIKVKQTIDFNLYLSSQAVKNAVRDPATLPSTLLLPKEIISIMNIEESKIRINVFTNQDVDANAWNKFITNMEFCSAQLNLPSISFEYIKTN